MPKPWIDFTALRSRARFEPVLTQYGLTALGPGPQKTVLCPFHEETEPSCKVNLEKRAFHCFGCGAKGNSSTSSRGWSRRSFPRRPASSQRSAASRFPRFGRLGAAHGPHSREQDESKSAPTRAARPHRKPQDAREAAIQLGKAQTPLCEHPGAPQTIVDPRSRPGRFLWIGATTPPAREDSSNETGDPINPPLTFRLKLDPTHPYLAARGVSPEVAETFGLGYCSRGMMKGRICIPIHNADGELVAYAGRWPGDSGWPEGEDKYKLPPGFRKSHVLFGLNRVSPGYEGCMLVEGFFSVFRLYAVRGVQGVALMGCSISDEQVELLARRTTSITVLMDGDAAGRAARKEIVARLAERLHVYAPLLPDGTSPDTLDNDALVRLTSDDPIP